MPVWLVVMHTYYWAYYFPLSFSRSLLGHWAFRLLFTRAWRVFVEKNIVRRRAVSARTKAEDLRVNSDCGR